MLKCDMSATSDALALHFIDITPIPFLYAQRLSRMSNMAFCSIGCGILKNVYDQNAERHFFIAVCCRSTGT